MSQVIKSLASGPVPPSVATSYVTDDGAAVPALNMLNVVTPGGGTQGIKTTGSGNTITISVSDTGFSGTATTSDAGAQVQTLSNPIPTTSNTVTSIRTIIVGRDTGSGDGIGGEILATLKNVAGTVTLSGMSDSTKNGDPSLITATFTAIAFGTEIAIQVSGVGGRTIDWKGITDIVSVT